MAEVKQLSPRFGVGDFAEFKNSQGRWALGEITSISPDGSVIRYSECRNDGLRGAQKRTSSNPSNVRLSMWVPYRRVRVIVSHKLCTQRQPGTRLDGAGS
jgi:hypothetical protein